jgi:dipeptidyl aminopeptidase/acylaminoacyl peptidase
VDSKEKPKKLVLRSPGERALNIVVGVRFRSSLGLLSILLLCILLLLTTGGTGSAEEPTLNGSSGNQMAPLHLKPGKSVVEARVSPDGVWLACVVSSKIPVGRISRFRRSGVPENGEVYLIALRGGAPSRITHGQKLDGSFFGLKWSPDSKKLAMISSVGGRLSPWLWDMRRKNLKRLTKESIDYPRSGIAWVGNDRLIWATTPVDQSFWAWYSDTETFGSAVAGLWKKADEGVVPTASVLDSPASLQFEKYQGHLVEYDARQATSRILYEGSAIVSPGDGSDSVPVFLLSGMSDMDTKRPYVGSAAGLGIYSLGLVSQDGLRMYGTPGFDVEVLRGVGEAPSVLWSPDRSEVVVIGTVRPRDFNGSMNPTAWGGYTGADKIYEVRRYKAVGDELRDLGALGPEFEMPKPTSRSQTWSATGELALLSWPHGALKIRADWWLQVPAGTLRCLTCEMHAAPPVLVSRKEGGFFGVDDGRLWSLSSTSGVTEDLSKLVRGRALDLEAAPDSGVTFLRVENNHQDRLIRVDTIADHQAVILTPGPQVFLSSYSPKNNAGVFLSDRGSRVYLSRDRKAPTLVIAASRLEEEEQGHSYDKVRIDYTTKSEKLVSWLYLPKGKRPARGYPAITISYPGMVETGDGSGSIEGPADGDWSDALLQHGYAILYASDPIQHVQPEVLRSLVDNVIPAVDEAIARGLVDPARIGVAGHSGGGYATLALITQTHRFKAAVALNGISDLTSNYLQMDTLNRYSAVPYDPLGMIYEESPLYPRGFGAPWEHPDLYARNSPITFVGNVDTPLLLIHGDLDTSCQIEQSEEFYLALRRQNKRVRFIRYFGEQHSNGSPANIRDENKRVVEWFDEYLKPGGKDTSAGQDSKDPPK